MIRFKKAAAADVPVPPAGYVTLFVDTATGQPSAKDSAGVVVSLKGTDGEDGDDGVAGLPEGGTLGQVLTRSADGAAWADAPAGEGGAVPWVDYLADSEFVPGDYVVAAHKLEMRMTEYEADGASRGVALRFTPPEGKRAINARLGVDIRLIGNFGDATHTGSVDLAADGFPAPGNGQLSEYQVERELYSPNKDGDYLLDFGVSLTSGAYDLPFVQYLSIEVTSLEVQFVDNYSEQDGEPLDVAPIPVMALSNGGGGGTRIPKADHPGATTIEILGYYDLPAAPDGSIASSVAGDDEFYPIAFPESAYVEVAPTAIDPTFLAGDAWGWYGGAAPIAFPAEQCYLCKVRIDGGAPMFAMLNNAGGV